MSASLAFRRRSTLVFRIALVAMTAVVAGLSLAGWISGGMLGLMIAAVLALGLAIGLFAAAGLLLALTRDRD